MPKVTSKKSISFPKLNWGISAGEERELPVFEKEEDTRAAQERILQEPEISLVDDKLKKSK